MKPTHYKVKEKDELNKPVTLGVLLEYTDDFLIPKIAEIVDDKIDSALAKHTHEMKIYIDRKLADYTSDIFRRLEKRQQTDKKFKQKVVEILGRNKLANPTEVAFLEGILEG